MTNPNTNRKGLKYKTTKQTKAQVLMMILKTYPISWWTMGELMDTMKCNADSIYQYMKRARAAGAEIECERVKGTTFAYRIKTQCNLLPRRDLKAERSWNQYLKLEKK